MSLDAATSAFVADIAAQGAPPVSAQTPAEARDGMAQLATLFGDAPSIEAVTDATIETEDGALPVRILRPRRDARGVVVYLHGGGWVMGSVDEWDTLARTIAARTGCILVLPEYRLAPEHPFPAAVDDSWACLEWAADHCSDQELPLMVAGDSAGANLAAVVAVRARDRGGPPLALQVLAYPITDCDFETGSYLDPENQLVLDRDSMLWFWDHYVPTAEERAHPEVSPLRSTSLAGVAPAAVLIAEHDVLRDEVEAYVSSLQRAGVATTSRFFPGQMHGFVSLMNLLPANRDGIDHICREIDRCLV